MKIKHKKRKDERGAALIAVMGLLALAAVLAASMVTLSQLSAASSRTSADLCLGGYAAEGGLAHAQWLLINDRQRHGDRAQGTKQTLKGPSEEERFLADGRAHLLKNGDFELEFAILDMANGLDVSGSNPAVAIGAIKKLYEKSAENKEAFAALDDRLQDYMDADDFSRIHGAEAADYQKLGMPGLPRNAPFRYREELLWIPGAGEFFKPDETGRLGSVRPIPPLGLAKPPPLHSFFSSSPEILRTVGGFSEEQTAKIISARELWHKNGTPVDSSLPADIFGLLRSRFAFRDSGFYTVIVTARPPGGGAQRMLIASFQLSGQLPAQGFQYYEWVRY